MALELIQIKDFPKTTSLAGTGEELIVVSKADGKTYGIKTSDFKAFLGTVQVTTPKPISPTDPAPTLDGVYIPTVTQNEAGTPIVYTNAGGLTVNTAEGGEDYGKAPQLINNGSVWVKSSYPLPMQDVSNLATKEEVNPLISSVSVLQDAVLDNIPLTGVGFTQGYTLKTGGNSGLAGYKRTSSSNTSAMYEYNGESLLFTGEVDREDMCGVQYRDADLVFLGWEIGVGNHINKRLSPPTGTKWIAASSKTQDPVLSIEIAKPFLEQSNLDQYNVVVQQQFSDVDERLTELETGGVLNRLEDSPYETLYTRHVTNNPIPDTGGLITNISSPNGLNVSISSIGNNGASFLDTEIPWPNGGSVEVIATIRSIIDQSIGLGYGNPITGNLLNSVIYRSSGQVFGFYRGEGEVSILNSSNQWAGRGADAQYAYAEGDVVALRADISNSKVITSINGVVQPEISAVELTPTGNILLAFRGNPVFESIQVIIRESSNTDIPEEIKTIYVSKAGSDDASGSSSSPFLTINKAIESLTSAKIGAIVISEGDYRETVDLRPLKLNKLTIQSAQNNKVRVLGSDRLTGWAKTSGRTNIYQIPFTGSVPTQSRGGRRLFEDGRASMPISVADRHTLQKGLSHRLPYSEIPELVLNSDIPTTLSDLDSSAGMFFLDNVNGVLYIHSTDSSNPSTNGFSYENQVRRTFTPPVNSTILDLELSFIEFCFSSSTGLDLLKIYKCSRYNISVFGSQTNGFSDECAVLYAYRDEAGGCGNDGAGNHFTRFPGYKDFDFRSGTNNVIYIDPWYHDNRDDGISHHEFTTGTGLGGLFEYNAKAGLIPANGSNWIQDGGVARNNGHGVFIGNPIDTKGYAVMTVSNFESYNNQSNYRVTSDVNWVLELINCISRNPTSVGFYCAEGRIRAINCKSVVSGSAVHISEVNGGLVEVINDPSLV